MEGICFVVLVSPSLGQNHPGDFALPPLLLGFHCLLSKESKQNITTWLSCAKYGRNEGVRLQTLCLSAWLRVSQTCTSSALLHLGLASGETVVCL